MLKKEVLKQTRRQKGWSIYPLVNPKGNQTKGVRFCLRWKIPQPFILCVWSVSVDTWDLLCIHNSISQFSEHAMAIDLDNAIAVTAIGRHSKFKK